MPDHAEFHGVLPALVTPFTADGADIDTGALTTIVERLIRGGVAGLVPGGSTGEFTTLTGAERRELIEVTVEAAAGRVPVVAGTGALSTREAVELSVHAERSGAAAVMIVPPFYDALSWRELLVHYAAVADRIEIPIMYYNLPSASGVKLTAAQLRELPITCLKDTGGDGVAATELIHTGGPTLLNGWDTLTFAALAAGVRAVVWGTASILPEQCVALHRLLIDDIDLPAARDLWGRLWPLCKFLEARATRQLSRPHARSSATPQARYVPRCYRSARTPPPNCNDCWTALAQPPWGGRLPRRWRNWPTSYERRRGCFS